MKQTLAFIEIEEMNFRLQGKKKNLVNFVTIDFNILHLVFYYVDEVSSLKKSEIKRREESNSLLLNALTEIGIHQQKSESGKNQSSLIEAS